MGQLSAILAGEAYVRYFAPRDEFERDTRANEKVFNESVDRMAETRRRDAERQERERRREAERRQRQYQIDLATVTAGGLYFGNQISAVGKNAIGGMLESVKEYGSIEGYLNQIRGFVRDNTNAIEADMKRIERQAYALGESSEYGAKQIASAQNLLSKEDKSPEQILKAMPSVVDLASIFSSEEYGQVSPLQASKAAMEMLNARMMEIEKLPMLVDKLAVAGSKVSLSLPDLADTSRYVGAIAKGTGIDFDEELALTVMLDRLGLKGEMGGTALRGMIDTILDPTPGSQKRLTAAGIRVPEKGDLSVLDIMQQFETLLSGKTNIERSRFIAEAFDRRQQTGVTALSNPESLELVRSLVAELKNSKGKAAELALTKRSGISFALDVVDSTFETFKAAFGKSIVNEVKVIAQAIAGALSFMATTLQDYPWIGKAIAGIALALLALGTAITTIGSIAGVVATFGALRRVLVYLTGSASLLRGMADGLAFITTRFKLTQGLLYAFGNSWAEGFVFLRFAIGSWISRVVAMLLSPVVLGGLLVAAGAALVYVLDQEFNSGRLTNPIIKAVDSVFGKIYDWLLQLGFIAEGESDYIYKKGSAEARAAAAAKPMELHEINLDQRPGETLEQYKARKASDQFYSELRTGFAAAWDVNSVNPKNAEAWADFQKENAGDAEALADKGLWRKFLVAYRRSKGLGGGDDAKSKVGVGASRSLQNLGDFELRSSAGVGLVLDLLTGKRDDDTAKQLLAEAEKTAANTTMMVENLKPKRIGGRG